MRAFGLIIEWAKLKDTEVVVSQKSNFSGNRLVFELYRKKNLIFTGR
jgi:hypothetical protein